MWHKKRTLEYFLTIFDKPSKKELEIIKDFFLDERMKEYRLTGIFLESPTKIS